VSPTAPVDNESRGPPLVCGGPRLFANSGPAFRQDPVVGSWRNANWQVNSPVSEPLRLVCTRTAPSLHTPPRPQLSWTSRRGPGGLGLPPRLRLGRDPMAPRHLDLPVRSDAVRTGRSLRGEAGSLVDAAPRGRAWAVFGVDGAQQVCGDRPAAQPVLGVGADGADDVPVRGRDGVQQVVQRLAGFDGDEGVVDFLNLGRGPGRPPRRGAPWSDRRSRRRPGLGRAAQG
jgi:hypothetical protein